MRNALAAALAELERQLAKRIPIVRVIVDEHGNEIHRIHRGWLIAAPNEQETSHD